MTNLHSYFAGDDPFSDTNVGNALTRAIVETIHEPFLVLDTDLRILVASRSFYEKFQVRKEDTQGQLLYRIEGGVYDIPALRHFLRNIIPEHAVMKEYKIVHEFSSIGHRVLLLSAREVLYENSKNKHLLLTIGDVTAQEFLEVEKEKLYAQKDLMLKEMKHRMANSLQLIASILILKSEAVQSEEVRSHLQDAHERIISIATIERFLDTTSLTQEVEVGPYLTSLCESLSKSMIGNRNPVTLTVHSDGGMTTSSDGISLGLITTELVINALKHAFPDRRAGSIKVLYEKGEDNKIGWRLSVSDDGVGMALNPTRREGLGTTIIQSLARQLSAKVDVKTSSKGTAVSIQYVRQTLPLLKEVAADKI